MLEHFPNIHLSFLVTSAQTDNYNCIGWAANDDANFWWPLGGYWPPGMPRTEAVESFEVTFASIGYAQRGLDASLVAGLEKVAIYVSPETGLVTHMARQLESGRWTSKLGPSFDIEHQSPECLNGHWYGLYSHCLGRSRAP